MRNTMWLPSSVIVDGTMEHHPMALRSPDQRSRESPEDFRLLVRTDDKPCPEARQDTRPMRRGFEIVRRKHLGLVGYLCA